MKKINQNTYKTYPPPNTHLANSQAIVREIFQKRKRDRKREIERDEKMIFFCVLFPKIVPKFQEKQMG